MMEESRASWALLSDFLMSVWSPGVQVDRMDETVLLGLDLETGCRAQSAERRVQSADRWKH